MVEAEKESIGNSVKAFLVTLPVSDSGIDGLAKKYKQNVDALIARLPSLLNEFAQTRKEWLASTENNRQPLFQTYSKATEELENAIGALGLIGDAQSVKPLLEILPTLEEEPTEPVLVQEILGVLGYFGDEKAVEPLCRWLHHKWDGFRKSSAKALGNIRSPLALEPLQSLLKDPDFSVRIAAINALGEIGDHRSVESLLSAAAEQRFPTEICTALGEIGDVGNERVVIFLKKAAETPAVGHSYGSDALLRMAACEALGKVGDDGVVELLNRIAATDPCYLMDQDTHEPVEWPVRDAASNALKELTRRKRN